MLAIRTDVWTELVGRGATCYKWYVRTVDAEIAKFARCQAAEFGNGFAVTAPVVVRAYEVHSVVPLKTQFDLL